MNKILSIIVPSYNMEKYLPKCLGSLVIDDAELLQRLDVIVVNDGSKDRTSEIAHDFESKYPGVFRVIDKPNGHYGSCVNSALKVALGTYVKILDADDWFDTVNFSKLIKWIENKCQNACKVDLIVSDFIIYNGERVLRRRYNFLSEDELLNSLDMLDSKENRDLWMHAVTYRTSILREVNYQQREGMAHTDWQWLFLPFTAVNSVAYFPDVIYEYWESRPGNTCNPTAYYATYHEQVSIIELLLNEYQSMMTQLGAVQKRYLIGFLRHRAHRIYVVYLVDRNPYLRPGVLEEFDAILKHTMPDMYEELGQLKLGGHRFPFYYVKDWRRNGKISFRRKLYEFLRKLYAKIRGWISK